MSGKALAAGFSAPPEPVASAIPLSYFFADPKRVRDGHFTRQLPTFVVSDRMLVGGPEELRRFALQRPIRFWDLNSSSFRSVFAEVQTMSIALGQTLEEWAEERGMERGIQRGELAATRRLLCGLLEDRFGPVPDDLRRQIGEIEDLARLERSIRRCPSLGSLEELTL